MSTKRQLRQRWEEEPGATIRKKALEYIHSTHKWDPEATGEKNDANQTLDSSIIFGLLAELPFRDELANGRDLRGSDLGCGWRSSFSNADFSYSSSCGSFFHCDLTDARFDEVTSEQASFHGILNGATFRNAKLHSCYINDSQARNCCFDQAKLYQLDFGNTDLSGSSFRNADCKRAAFAGANLTNCDFRGANLEESIFREAIIDKTTDFRGASLINAASDDYHDNAGNLLYHGIDLRQATYDETTKFGEDSLAFPLEVRQQAIEIARRDYGLSGEPIAALCERLIQHMQSIGAQDHAWEKSEIAKLSPAQQALYKQVMDETFKSLL